MKELIILVGISGSGKSTWADHFLNLNKNYLRINRDDLRRVLIKDLTSYYNKPHLYYIEKIINRIENDMFITLYDANSNIIIDNTNLTQKYINKWLNLAEQYNYKVKFKLCESKVKDAKCRVLNRDYQHIIDDLDSPMSIRPTMENVKYIDKQYTQYQLIREWILTKFKDQIL